VDADAEFVSFALGHLQTFSFTSDVKTMRLIARGSVVASR
jgi:hypothetical protein